MATKFDVDEITTVEQFEEEINSPMLKVIEAYGEQWGSCKATLGNLKYIYFELDQADKKLKYWKVEHRLVRDLQERPTTSKPIFLFYKLGALIDIVIGANAPLLKKLIDLYVPTLAQIGVKNPPTPQVTADAKTRLVHAGILHLPTMAEAVNAVTNNMRSSFKMAPGQNPLDMAAVQNAVHAVPRRASIMAREQHAAAAAATAAAAK
eukprot:tig00020556_g11014.t1